MEVDNPSPQSDRPPHLPSPINTLAFVSVPNRELSTFTRVVDIAKKAAAMNPGASSSSLRTNQIVRESSAGTSSGTDDGPESPSPGSRSMAELTARPENVSRPTRENATGPVTSRFHCHLCKELVPANWFLATQNGRLCRLCHRCRGQPEWEVSEADIKRHLRELKEREKRFYAGDFLRSSSHSRLSRLKRKVVSSAPSPRQAPRRPGRFDRDIQPPAADRSGEGGGSEEEVDREEEEASQANQSQDRRIRMQRIDKSFTDSASSVSRAMKLIATLSNDVSALRKEVASLANAATTTQAAELPRATNGRDTFISPTSSSESLAIQSYPWIAPDVVQLVGRDQLKPEQLVHLRHPSSRVVKSSSMELSDPTLLGAGNMPLPLENWDRIAHFVHVVPNVRAFAQLWMTYIDIRALFKVDHSYLSAYKAFLTRILDLDSIYDWKAGLCQYVLSVCSHRFGAATPEEWRKDDLPSSNDFLISYQVQG